MGSQNRPSGLKARERPHQKRSTKNHGLWFFYPRLKLQNYFNP